MKLPSSLSGASLASVVFFSLGSVLAQDAAAPADKVTHTSSLGVPFVQVDKLPIHFAIWETRVSDYEPFRQSEKLPPDTGLYFQQTGQHPVINVNYDEAVRYCEWLTTEERAAQRITAKQRYRLPTNFEWSAAAGLGSTEAGSATDTEQRLRDEKAFPWGLEWPPPQGAGNFASTEIAGYVDDFPHTAPVGRFNANRYGIHDLAGNVWEWCVPDDETRRLSKYRRNLRGGSWIYFRKEAFLSGFEYEVASDLRAPTFGFRLVFEDDDVSDRYYSDLRRKKDGMVASRSDELIGRNEEGDDDEIARRRAQLIGQRTGAGSGGDDLEVQINNDVAEPVSGRNHVNTLGMELLPLEEGVLMGAHEVRLREMDFFLQRENLRRGKVPSYEQKPSHALSSVTYAEAEAFCDWLTRFEKERGSLSGQQRYRLPTDAEWSLAVGLGREKTGTPADRHMSVAETYPWGEQWPPPRTAGNFNDSRLNTRDRYTYTAPVGNYSPLRNGFHDLAGNVSEWVSDYWDGGEDRVARGSSWIDGEKDRLNSSYRRKIPPGRALPDLGFRVVLDLR